MENEGDGMEMVDQAQKWKKLRKQQSSLSFCKETESMLVEWNDPLKEKVLQLMFIGELPDTVRTSTVLKSKNGQSIKLVLVDPETGEIVDYVPESCAEVEIVVLEGDHSVTPENFERRIIKTGEKKKPHFVKRVFINLVNGVGCLNDVKLGQDSGWTNIRKCRLGTRIIGHNLYAWTSPFKVKDNRLEVTKKHYPPLPSSEVWRLDQIGIDGERHKRLKANGIYTVGLFLCRLQRDPEGLKKIVFGHGGGHLEWKTIVEHAQSCTTDDDDDDQMMSQTNVGKLKSRFVSIDNLSAADKILLGGGGGGNSDWEAIVDHAKKTCTTDDDQRMFSHKSSIDPQTSVVYNFVGKLKGVVINESHFVPIDDLSANDKVHAYKLLSSVLQDSAFGERHDTPFNVEASLPDRSFLEITASTDSSLQPLCYHIYQATERCSSSQNSNPNNLCDSGPAHSRVSEEMGGLCNPGDLGTLDLETPLLSDEVSRLVNICKNGEIHKRFHVNGINTVEEFLIWLLRDEEEIRQIVSLEREEWEATVSNAAQACSTGNRMYCYTSLKLKKGVVFNLLGKVLGLLSFDKHFCPTNMLSEDDKREARELLASARKNWRDVERYNEPDHLHGASMIASGSNGLP